MIFRPNRFEALHNLIRFLNPGGQIVLTFHSMGTFDSLWNQVDRAMTEHGYENERQALIEHIEKRPSADDARQWLEKLGWRTSRSPTIR